VDLTRSASNMQPLGVLVRKDATEDLLPGKWLNGSGIDRIKLGTGFVGRLTTTISAFYVVLFAAVICAAYLGDKVLLERLMWLGAGAFVLYLLISFIFALINPAASVLEGTELVKYREIEVGAKGMLPPLNQENVAPTIELRRDGGE
jgi:hypothetical protein